MKTLNDTFRCLILNFLYNISKLIEILDFQKDEKKKI